MAFGPPGPTSPEEALSGVALGLSGPVWPLEALVRVGLRPRTHSAGRGFVGAVHRLSGPVWPMVAFRETSAWACQELHSPCRLCRGAVLRSAGTHEAGGGPKWRRPQLRQGSVPGPMWAEGALGGTGLRPGTHAAGRGLGGAEGGVQLRPGTPAGLLVPKRAEETSAAFPSDSPIP